MYRRRPVRERRMREREGDHLLPSRRVLYGRRRVCRDGAFAEGSLSLCAGRMAARWTGRIRGGDIVNVSLHIATDGCNTPTTDCGPAGHPVAEISVILSQDPTCWNCGHHRRTNPVDPCDNADCQIVSCTNTTGRLVIPQRLWDRVRQRQFPVHGLPGQRRRCPLRGEAVYDLRWFRGAQCLCHSDGPPCDHVPVPHRGCAARRLDAGFAAALRRGYNEDDGEEHPPPAGGVCDEKCDEHVGAARKNPLPFVYRRRRL